MTKKIVALEPLMLRIQLRWPRISIRWLATLLSRKSRSPREGELLVLWTDYFKPPHLEQYPNLHTTFWKAATLCSAVKVEVSVEHAGELMDAIKEIHTIFWATKGRDVAWYTAS